MLPKLHVIVLILIAILILIGVAISISLPYQWHGAVINPPALMPDFTLQSDQGPVSPSNFRGKFILLYFGYTSCPDVCPITMSNLANTMRRIGDRANQIQVIFVSVDWKRDTPEKLGAYARAFFPSFIGITGTQAQIDQVTKESGIFYKLNPPDRNGFYSVDHTAIVLVLDRNGYLVLTWPYGFTSSDFVDDLTALLKK